MDFTLLRGTAIGGSHLEAATNGQDALSVRATATSIVAVIADGCSSQPHSESGAQIVAPMLSAYIEQALRKGQSLEDPRIWSYLRALVLAKILSIATDMAGDDPVAPVLNQYFQFTLVGMVMTPSYTVFFSRGDGMFAINGKITKIAPEAGNRPAYIVYGLTKPDMAIDNPHLLEFDIQAVPTSDIESWWVGTDGVEEMLDALGRLVNGEKIVEPQLLMDDPRYLSNPTLLSRRLQQLVAADLIGDDITLVIGQRITVSVPDEPAPAADLVPTENDPEPNDTASEEAMPGKDDAALVAAGVSSDVVTIEAASKDESGAR